MSRQLEKTLKNLMEDIEAREGDLLADKKTVNALCRRLGRSEPYPVPASKPPVARSGAVVRADQFATEPTIAAAVRAFLRWKGKAAGPQSFKTIFETLTYGGFRFGGGAVDKRMDALRAVLAEAPFVRSLGDDWFALAERPAPVARPRARLRS